MHRAICLPLVFCVYSACVSVAPAQDPFAQHVRTTDPLSAEQQQQSFRLPPGFEIQLVAAEPDIQKPLNMAFDARGRLWVTDTREYPYAVPVGQPGRDTVKVLEDTDGDGRADHVTTFADGLNIPIGILPYDDGAIVFSIPNIWRLRDTDGDGQADVREKLYGPFGHDRDTHGLNNAFRRAFDGWIYACHGFNNNTTVAGADGHTITMNSGNTYRFRADGSRIEQFTWGQVNPFGMAVDPLGNLFTADCHSKPIYQLLRGGYYPSFGKPHDGLGYVEPMMQHLHGSTAIAGVAVYTGRNFPESYRGHYFSGNVMTSRVNRDSPVYHGSTILAREQPDFVSTTDPWFRPVDVIAGPDGALYIADFYNRVIGHYEVPLDHPGRDRHRGRIWRVVYTGDDPSSEPVRMPGDLNGASTTELIAALDHAVLEYRLLAANELVDRGGQEVISSVRAAFESYASSSAARSHLLWVLARLQSIDEALLAAASADGEAAVRVHAMKALAEMTDWSSAHRSLVLAAVDDDDAFVRRAAADALGQHPDRQFVRPLLDMLPTIPEADNHLRHTVRMALRNQLRDEPVLRELTGNDFTEADARAVVGVCLALESAASGSYLLQFIERFETSSAFLSPALQHAARFAPPEESDRLAAIARGKLSGQFDQQLALLLAVYSGYQQRGAAPGGAVVDWASELAVELLDSIDDNSAAWSNSHLPGNQRTDDPWVLERRSSADGNDEAMFFCSLPRGEQLTGVLRSPTFEIPAELTFYLAGHAGFPNQPATEKNFVRLRDALSQRIVGEAAPARNDTAQPVRWDLTRHAGRSGYLEIVDGDDGAAYAWLAVGRFDPPVVRLPRQAPRDVAQRQQAAASIIGQFGLRDLTPRLANILLAGHAHPTARQAAAQAMVQVQPDGRIAALAPVIGDWSIAPATRDEICGVVASRNPEALRKTLADAIRTSPTRVQQTLAENLAGDGAGAEVLLTLVEEGHAAGRLLLFPAVAERLNAVLTDDGKKRIATLTAHLPSEDDDRRKLMEHRLATYAQAEVSHDRGAALYTKHCRICHQLDGEGPLIGPQLDGIGNRGLERLIEDTLAPNRNVDVAFRGTTIVTTDGRALTGLFRRREGATLVFANNEGKEFAIAENAIDEQSKSAISLMPDNVARELTESEFFDLMAFLLSKRNVPEQVDGRR